MKLSRSAEHPFLQKLCLACNRGAISWLADSNFLVLELFVVPK